MEYVIRGKKPNETQEILLLETVEGKIITSKKDALGYEKVLKDKYKCTDTRIQEINFSGYSLQKEFTWIIQNT